MTENELLEKVAALSHERWSNWMKYQASLGTKNEDGSFTISAAAMDRWNRQMATPYESLSEQEKASDRKEALLYSVAWGVILPEAVKRKEEEERVEQFKNGKFADECIAKIEENFRIGSDALRKVLLNFSKTPSS